MQLSSESTALSKQAVSDKPIVHIRIEPSHGWRVIDFGELWRYRDLLRFMTIRDIKARYQQMALGPLWVIIRPVISMVVYSLIFGGLAQLPSGGVPYPIFAYTALLPWTYFSGIAGGTANSLRANMHLIAKVYFPRLTLPITLALTGLVDFGISFVILLGLMLYYGYVPSLAILTLPLYMLFAAATALGLGLWFAGINVRYRDVGLFFGYIMTSIQWISPIAYSAEIIAERYPQWFTLYKVNPMFWVIEGFRWALLGTGNPPELIMIIPVSLVLLMLISGAYIFHRTERTVVDIQ